MASNLQTRCHRETRVAWGVRKRRKHACGFIVDVIRNIGRTRPQSNVEHTRSFRVGRVAREAPNSQARNSQLANPQLSTRKFATPNSQTRKSQLANPKFPTRKPATLNSQTRNSQLANSQLSTRKLAALNSQTRNSQLTSQLSTRKPTTTPVRGTLEERSKTHQLIPLHCRKIKQAT